MLSSIEHKSIFIELIIDVKKSKQIFQFMKNLRASSYQIEEDRNVGRILKTKPILKIHHTVIYLIITQIVIKLIFTLRFSLTYLSN